MALRFDPPELFDRWKAAVAVLVEHCEAKNWPGASTSDLDPDDFDPDDYDDCTLTLESVIENVYPGEGCMEGFSVQLGTLIEWAAELPTARIEQRTYYLTKGRALVHVLPLTDSGQRFVHREEVDGGGFYPQQAAHSGRNFRLSMTVGITPFAFLINGCDEYCPSCLSEDVFVELRFDGTAPVPEAVREIVAGYLFALSTAHLGGDFEIAPFRGPYEEFYAYDDEDEGRDEGSIPAYGTPEWEPWNEGRLNSLDELRRRFAEARRAALLRPVILGKGLADLHGMFLRALSPDHDLEYRVLSFAKVVEYVSLTAVKQKAHGEIRRRLMDVQVLAPDARFIEDLIQLVDAQREYKKDAEALRIAVREFADSVTLAQHAPAFLPTLRGCSQVSPDKDKERALDELAASISATRNQIAHGKANYGSTGRECPPEQMAAFVELLRKLSVQAILWFAALPEPMRVVK